MTTLVGRPVDLTARQLSLSGSSAVEFGVGAVTRLPGALAAVGARRVFVVTDPGVRDAGVLARVLAPLESAGVSYVVFDEVHANPTTADVVSAAGRATPLLRDGHGDVAVLALGGGSALDVAKGVGLLAGEQIGLPLVAVPTTAGTGAETNGFAVLADPVTHAKVYLGDASVRPRVSILDPELTLGVPPVITASTGMDALTHGVESLASRSAHPLSEAYAARAITLVGAHLERAVRDGNDLEARGQLMFGAHLAGLALTLSGLGLVHGIAHAVTGHVGAAHGLALAAVLDTVMETSASTAEVAYQAVAVALGAGSSAGAAIDACRALADTVGARRTLGSFGANASMLPTIAHDALADVVSGNAPWLPDVTGLEDLLATRL